ASLRLCEKQHRLDPQQNIINCCFAALLLCEQKPKASTPEGCCGLKQTTKHNPLPLCAFARNSTA
ncbi:hypothetical protein, partial [Chitinophaga dinghuensis]|uniref:hypothetical protein n=1 Tax=Chitinophaga dinghuensis TaxID=1539050 RepID=UPI001B8601E3